jgi:hypothetical protein
MNPGRYNHIQKHKKQHGNFPCDDEKTFKKKFPKLHVKAVPVTGHVGL